MKNHLRNYWAFYLFLAGLAFMVLLQYVSTDSCSWVYKEVFGSGQCNT